MLDETMKAWIYQLNGEEREQIVDTVFGMLEAADIKTVDDFYHSKWKAVQELMKAKSRLPEKSQKVFAKALKLLWSEGNKTVRKTVKQVVGEKRRWVSKKSIKSKKMDENIKIQENKRKNEKKTT